MGFFDIFSTTETTAFTANSERQAWMSFIVACMKADGEITDIETSKMTNSLHINNVFGYGGNYIDLYTETMINCDRYGGKALVDGSIGFVHADSRDTLFTVCADIVLADGIVTNEEKELLAYIAEKLMISEELARKIIEVLMIKNKRNLKSITIEE